MRPHPVVALAVALVFMAGPTLAAQIVDSSGQLVDATVDQQISDARMLRMLRMSNITATYDPKKSVDLLQQIVSAHPDYYRARYNLALSQLELSPDRPEIYLPTFADAIQIQESNPAIKDGSIFNTVGWLDLNQRNYDSAETLFRRSLDLASTNTSWTNSAANYNLGRLYFERSDFQNALTYLNVSIERYGNPAAISLKQVVLDTIGNAPPSPMSNKVE